jgi:hypothetical protein
MGLLNILLALLLYVLVGGGLVYLAFWVIDLIVPVAPINRIAKGIIALFVFIVAIYLVAGLFGLEGAPHLVLFKT